MTFRSWTRLVLLGIVAGTMTASVAWGGSRATARQARGLHLVRLGTFQNPVFATSAPSEPANVYVVEQPGRILVLRAGKVRPTPFLDIRSIVRSGGERGLLSVAFDPEYASNHLFYVDYTDLNGDTRIVRYRSSGGRAVLSSAKHLMFVKDFAPNHNGGQLAFGPDGLLYWGNGDGGGGGDPEQNGQSLARNFAKIQRLDVRAPKPHWRLVAYGLRNPWRFSFDRMTGDLVIADVGQEKWEEIDYLAKGAATPVNYGWRHYEGPEVYDGSMPLLRTGRYIPPAYAYRHPVGCSITGGYVYRGSKVPAAVGRYFFGDYCTARVWSMTFRNGKGVDVRREPFDVGGLSSFGETASGELLLMSVGTGALYRLAG